MREQMRMLSDYPLYAKIIEAGSLSAAGRALNMSPAMVSKRLTRLEAQLGARLIHRTTRRLITTDVGQRFYDQVVAILDASREAERGVTGRAMHPSGPLRITAPTSFGRLHVAPNLPVFLRRYPDIELELDLSDTFTDFLADRFDVAIRIAPAVSGHLVSHLLTPNRRVLCAAPGYLAEHGEPTTLAELAGHHLLAASNQLPWKLEGRGKVVSFEGRSLVTTNSSEVVRELTVTGLGIALRSRWDVSHELEAGTLRRVLPAYEGASDVGIYAVHLPAPLISPAVQVLIHHMKELFASPPWDET